MNIRNIYQSAKKYAAIGAASVLIPTWIAGNIYNIRQEQLDTQNSKYIANWTAPDAPIFGEKVMGLDHDNDGNVDEIKTLALGVATPNGVFMGANSFKRGDPHFQEKLEWLIENNEKE